jgi:hypothetical protein
MGTPTRTAHLARPVLHQSSSPPPPATTTPTPTVSARVLPVPLQSRCRPRARVVAFAASLSLGPREISGRRGRRQEGPRGARVALLNRSLHRFDQLPDPPTIKSRRSSGVGIFMTTSKQKFTPCTNHTGQTKQKLQDVPRNTHETSI